MFEGMFEIFNNDKKKDEETEISYPESSSSSEPASSSPSYSNYSSSRVFVISVGGSILIKNKPDKDAIAAISSCLNDLIRQGYKLVLVVGGGKIARDYVNTAKDLGANNFELDELGIRVTRANAFLLSMAIDNAHPQIITNIKETDDVLAKGKTPIFGGLMPGFTTDAVGALLAEYLGGTFINLSNVDGIYTADPAAHPTARMYHEISYDKLLQILTSNAMKPGQNLILDLPAAMVLKRSGISAFFLNGQDTDNIKSAIQGGSFKGTVVRPEAVEAIDGDEPVAPKPKRKKKKVTKKKSARRVIDDEYEELNPDHIRF